MSSVTPIKVTEEDKRMARVAKFRGKKPRKPKTKTERSLKNYITRYNVWAKKVKDAAKKGRAIHTEREKLRKLKERVSSL